MSVDTEAEAFAAMAPDFNETREAALREQISKLWEEVRTTLASTFAGRGRDAGASRGLPVDVVGDSGVGFRPAQR